MSLIVDNDFEFNLITPTPRASQFPPIQIPSHPYPLDALSPYSSPDSSTSPYSSPSPQTDYSTTTSMSLSPASAHMDLPQDVDDYSQSLNFAHPLSKSPKTPARARANPPPRKGDPAYIPRPENAFILFRKDAVQKMRAAEAAEAAAAASSGDKGKRQRQADMSKYISHLWKALPPNERAEWEERAAKIKREHEAKHPDYRYQPARPGANVKRASSKTAKSRVIRKRSGLENDDDTSGLSEDLSIVVRPTRGPRRGSVASVASSVSSVSSYAGPISLPFTPAVGSRPGSPYPTPNYNRSPRLSRQWIQPPNEDPSPPPTELYFPRGTARSGLDIYKSNVPALQPSPLSEDETANTGRPIRSRTSGSRDHSDKATVFVEPITSDHNPWSSRGATKFPATPRRGSVRSRPRSQSQPYRVDVSRPTPIEVDEPTFEFNLGWSPQTPESPATDISPLSSRSSNDDRASSLSSPWPNFPLDVMSADMPQPMVSSPESDCANDFGTFDMSEDWMNMLDPSSLDLDALVSEHPFFGYQSFGSQSEENDDPERPYTIVNLDAEGRATRSLF